LQTRKMRKAHDAQRDAENLLSVNRQQEPHPRGQVAPGVGSRTGGRGKTLGRDSAGSKGGRGSLEAGDLASPGQAVPEW